MGSPHFLQVRYRKMMHPMKKINQLILLLVITLITDGAIAETQTTELGKPDNSNFIAESPLKKALNIGGAVRINYSYKEYDEQSKATLGSLDFELFRLNVASEIGPFKLFAQYRWYSEFSMPEYAYMSYELNDKSEFQFGLNKVPFGVLPYSSFGYWESILYHLGLEDDNDIGLKYSYANQLWELDLGFYKNSELSSDNHARYSFDVVTDAEKKEFNREVNQFNVRVQRNFSNTSLGFSLQYGELYNEQSSDTGEHSAYAIHLTSSYENWHVQLELGSYQYKPKNQQGQDTNKVFIAAFDNAFYVASEADFYLLNVSRDIGTSFKVIDEMSCYNNFGIVIPKQRSVDVGNKTLQNLLGCTFNSDAITTYVELISGVNSAFVNGPGVGLVDDKSWSHRININVGYYF
jgi:hypothetical protein